MTPHDLRALTVPNSDHPWERRGAILVPLFGREVSLLVSDAGSGPPITQAMADALTAVVALAPERWADIASLLYADAVRSCADVDYGFDVADGETMTQANCRAFGLNCDGSAPSGWAQHAWLLEVAVYPAQTSLSFAVDWEEEHGFHLTLDGDDLVCFNP